MQVNVYDFDKTIYKRDSTQDFYFFCITREPSALLALPRACIYYVKYKLRLCDKTRFKETFYGFLRHIPDVESLVDCFWERNIDKIQPWYLRRMSNTDIIISASPEFLLRPACKRLGIEHLIASKVDFKTGKTEGQNCRGKEKVIRFNSEYPNCEIAEFFSDSRSDAPLAELAAKSYIITGETIAPW